jgi:hypothetical protein
MVELIFNNELEGMWKEWLWSFIRCRDNIFLVGLRKTTIAVLSVLDRDMNLKAP